jgi:hypothetical protein
MANYESSNLVLCTLRERLRVVRIERMERRELQEEVGDGDAALVAKEAGTPQEASRDFHRRKGDSFHHTRNGNLR